MKQGRVGKYHNAYNGSNNHGDIENATYMNQQIFPAAANLEDPAFITPNYKGVELYIPFSTIINLRWINNKEYSMDATSTSFVVDSIKNITFTPNYETTTAEGALTYQTTHIYKSTNTGNPDVSASNSPHHKLWPPLRFHSYNEDQFSSVSPVQECDTQLSQSITNSISDKNIPQPLAIPIDIKYPVFTNNEDSRIGVKTGRLINSNPRYTIILFPSGIQTVGNTSIEKEDKSLSITSTSFHNAMLFQPLTKEPKDSTDYKRKVNTTTMELPLSHGRGQDKTMLPMKMINIKTTTNARHDAGECTSREYTYTTFPTPYTNKIFHIQGNIYTDSNVSTNTNRNTPCHMYSTI